MREYQGKRFKYILAGVERTDYRLIALHYAAKALGVLFHFHGLPYGSGRNLKRDIGGFDETTKTN